jgi:hypothetical protein
VFGKPITGPVTVTDADLDDYVGAFVLANDVSARDIQLPQGQWYKGKSYRTFCPVGPYLCVPDPGRGVPLAETCGSPCPSTASRGRTRSPATWSSSPPRH